MRTKRHAKKYQPPIPRGLSPTVESAGIRLALPPMGISVAKAARIARAKAKADQRAAYRSTSIKQELKQEVKPEAIKPEASEPAAIMSEAKFFTDCRAAASSHREQQVSNRNQRQHEPDSDDDFNFAADFNDDNNMVSGTYKVHEGLRNPSGGRKQPSSDAFSWNPRPSASFITHPPSTRVPGGFMAQLPRPSSHSDAHALKAMLPAPSATIPFIGKKGSRRRLPEQDPENHEIKRLRTEERLSWREIVKIMNTERIKNGGEPTYTESSVYSRFVRNGPRIAQMQGETLDPKDWMHLEENKGAKGVSGGKKMKWDEVDKLFLVEAFGETQQEFWDFVAEKLEEKSGKKFEARECAEMYVRI